MKQFEPTPELIEFHKLVGRLHDEVCIIKSYSDNFENDLDRSHYVRAVFAAIEATVWAVKQVALSSLSPMDINDGERELLRDVRYELSNSGTVKEMNNHLRIAHNLRFAFNIWARCHSVEYEVPVSVIGWSHFIDAIRVRNRLTHPKHSDDLNISDEEYSSVEAAYNWIRDQLAYINREGIKGLLPVDLKSDDFIDRLLNGGINNT